MSSLKIFIVSNNLSKWKDIFINFIVIAGFGGFEVGLLTSTFCYWLTTRNVHRNLIYINTIQLLFFGQVVLMLVKFITNNLHCNSCLSIEILHEGDVLAQANLISAAQMCTLWISGHGLFVSVFSSMCTVPQYWPKYMRQTFVLVWNSTLQKKFNFNFWTVFC